MIKIYLYKLDVKRLDNKFDISKKIKPIRVDVLTC